MDRSRLQRAYSNKSKTLPHTIVVSQNNAESYANLSGDLNSTVSSSALLQGQNSTYVGNESRTEIQTENMSEAVTLNRLNFCVRLGPFFF